jgi:hypothetical protein
MTLLLSLLTTNAAFPRRNYSKGLALAGIKINCLFKVKMHTALCAHNRRDLQKNRIEAGSQRAGRMQQQGGKSEPFPPKAHYQARSGR